MGFEINYKYLINHISFLRLSFIKYFYFSSLFIFPRAGPDIKYLLGFIRTQLSTTTTIVLVFGPKVPNALPISDKLK